MILPPVEPSPELRVSESPRLRDDTRFAAAKIAIFQYVAVAIFLFLISGFWKLQVKNPQFYDERAQRRGRGARSTDWRRARHGQPPDV